MADMKLGKLIDSDQQKDAIHIAVAPMVAAERLSPGQHVGLVGSAAGVARDTIGIVDPFLECVVMKGDRFWLFLYPNTVTSLRHEWTHPAFTNEPNKPDDATSEAYTWLSDFAYTVGLSYHELMDGAKDYLKTGAYLCQGGRWEGVRVPDEFWKHYETVTGTKVDESNLGTFFSCSC